MSMSLKRKKNQAFDHAASKEILLFWWFHLTYVQLVLLSRGLLSPNSHEYGEKKDRKRNQMPFWLIGQLIQRKKKEKKKERKKNRRSLFANGHLYLSIPSVILY